MSEQKNRVVWLASYPKSGNTWIRLFLASYLATDQQIDPNEALRGSYHDAVSATMQKLLGVDVTAVDNQVVAALRLPYLRKLAENGKHDILVKTHVVNGVWNDAAMIPASVTRRAIYIVRHPFDVAVSFAKHYGLSLDETVQAMGNPNFAIGSDNQVRQPLHTWSKHVDSWCEEPGSYPSLILRYEDLQGRPALSFANLVRFMGLKLDFQQLQRALDMTAFSNLKKFEKENGFKEESDYNKGEFFGHGRAGAGLEILTKAQKGRLTKDHAETMNRLGYGADGSY